MPTTWAAPSGRSHLATTALFRVLWQFHARTRVPEFRFFFRQAPPKKTCAVLFLQPQRSHKATSYIRTARGFLVCCWLWLATWRNFPECCCQPAHHTVRSGLTVAVKSSQQISQMEGTCKVQCCQHSVRCFILPQWTSVDMLWTSASSRGLFDFLCVFYFVGGKVPTESFQPQSLPASV